MNDFHQLFAFHISRSNRKIQSLFDYVDPALRSFDVTHLDAGQCLEANSVQPLNGRVYYVNSNTNFVSLNDGQAMVQIASNSPYPGPNGLGGITVQGSASNVQVKQENNGNVYLSMSVQGIFISATVNLVLYSGTNNAMVTVDPNFSGRNLRMTGTLLPYSQSNIFQGTTY